MTEFCPLSCACPAPPQPIRQLELAVWLWLLVWLVLLLLPARLPAPLRAPWLALFEPPEMLPPATLTGTLAFTAVWLAFAREDAP